ncbi:uncharacterized protein METZ01_LOCUS209647, partial [marine metagenome]
MFWSRTKERFLLNNFLYRVAVVWAVLAAFGARADHVVINEVMYNPRGDAPEWIELSNITATPFDIAGWTLQGDVELDFPSFDGNRANDAFLGHWQKIILTNIDSVSFRQQYGIPSSVKVFGPWKGSLPNEGGRITVRDKNGVPVCTLGYSDRGRWPIAADGAGHTLVLKNPDRVVDDWRNWRLSKQPGGTPGVALKEGGLGSSVILIDYDDTWKYNDQNKNLGTAWRRNTYNDSSWKSGGGLLGVENSTLPGPGLKTEINKGNQLCYYFRKKIIFDGDPRKVTLTIDQIIDDGAVYYLNGQEVGRSRITGNVTFTKQSSSTVGNATEEMDVVAIEADTLKRGSNVLAVEVHQANTTSSDIVFGCRLRAYIAQDAGISDISLRLNEVNFTADSKVDWVELYNDGEGAVDLNGLSVATRRDFSDRTPLFGQAPSRGAKVVEVD